MILAIDLGTKRTGLAISDGQWVREYATLLTGKRLITDLQAICLKEKVTILIVGLPISRDGTESSQTAWVRSVASAFTSSLNVPIWFVDECLTSIEAKRQMESQGINESEIARRIDQYSAKLILEQYLSEQRDTHP